MIKKGARIILILALTAQLGLGPCFANGVAYPLISGFLFEYAISLYEKGDLKDALQEFKKLLIIEPQHKQALHYVQLLEGKKEITAIATEPIVVSGVVPVMPGVAARKVLIDEPQIEEELAEEEIALPVKKVGQVSVFINGEEVQLEKPLILKGGDLFIPLSEASRLLSYTAIDLGANKIRLISPEGESKEVKVSVLEGEPVISQNELNDYFSVESSFENLKKELYIITKYPTVMKVYAIKAPEKEAPLPGVISQEPLEQQDTSKEKPRYTPDKAKPYAELKHSVSYTYINYHTQSPYKNLRNSLYGRIGDFKINASREDEEISGKFDHDYTWLNLERPGLWMGFFDQSVDLSPLRSQYQSLTGIKVMRSWDALNKTTFLGGQTDDFISSASGTVKYLGDIVGLEQEYWPLTWLGTRSALLYLENEAETADLSGTTDYPRRNIINFFDTVIKINPKLVLSGQIAHAYYTPDNEPSENVSDFDWRISQELKDERLNLRANYEFVGDKYVSLSNPVSYRDFKGWDLYGNYKVSDVWALSGYFKRYQDNVEEDPTQVTNTNQSESLSSSHRFWRDKTLNFTAGQTTSNPSGPNPGTSSRSNLYRADFFTPFLGHSLLLNHQYYVINSPDNTLDFYSQTYGGTIFKSFGPGWTWSLHEDYIKSFYKTGTDKDSFSASFSLYCRIKPALDLSLRPSYSWSKSEGAKSIQTVSNSAGLLYKVSPDTTLRMDYSITNYNLKTEKDKWPREWSILTSLTKNFSFATPPRYGKVAGRIFQDTNNNFKLDSADDPAQGAKIKLQDGRVALADAKGNFSFYYVTPEKQKLYLDLEDLPIEWTSRELEKEVFVNPFKMAKVDILLFKSSLVSGRVFIDENNDSIFQDNEEPLEGVVLTLLPEEQIRGTDSEGVFTFDNVLFGRYKLKINKEDLPVGYELVSDETYDILILPGEKVEGLNFVVRLKQESPIQKF